MHSTEISLKYRDVSRQSFRTGESFLFCSYHTLLSDFSLQLNTLVRHAQFSHLEYITSHIIDMPLHEPPGEPQLPLHLEMHCEHVSFSYFIYCLVRLLLRIYWWVYRQDDYFLYWALCIWQLNVFIDGQPPITDAFRGRMVSASRRYAVRLNISHLAPGTCRARCIAFMRRRQDDGHEAAIRRGQLKHYIQ